MRDPVSRALAEVRAILGENVVSGSGSAVPRSMSPSAQSMNWLPSIIGYGADEDADPAAEKGWTCPKCGYENAAERDECSLCHYNREKKPESMGRPDVMGSHDVYWDSGNSKDEGKIMMGRRMNESLENIGRVLTEDPKMSPHLKWDVVCGPENGIDAGPAGDLQMCAVGRKGTWCITVSKNGPANLVLLQTGTDAVLQNFSEFGSDEEARSYASQADVGATGVQNPG